MDGCCEASFRDKIISQSGRNILHKEEIFKEKEEEKQ